MDENSRYRNNRTITYSEIGMPCPSVHYCLGDCMRNYWLPPTSMEIFCTECLHQGTSDGEILQRAMVHEFQTEKCSEGVVVHDLKTEKCSEDSLPVTSWQKKFAEKVFFGFPSEEKSYKLVLEKNFVEKKCSARVFDRTFEAEKRSEKFIGKAFVEEKCSEKSCDMTFCRRTPFCGPCQDLQTENCAERSSTGIPAGIMEMGDDRSFSLRFGEDAFRLGPPCQKGPRCESRSAVFVKHHKKVSLMVKSKNYLSLGLRGGIFYDGTVRICLCLEETRLKDDYLTAKLVELVELKDTMRRTLYYKADLERVKEESILLRKRLAGLKRQVVWWTKYGSADEKASAQHLLRIINAYGALSNLELREYRTTADLVLRDLDTETARADIAVLSGMTDLVAQLSDSLEAIREKQDFVDKHSSESKPVPLSEIKRSIAAKVNAVMVYITGNVDAHPEAFAKLLHNLETILDNANHRNIVMQAAAEAAPAVAIAK